MLLQEMASWEGCQANSSNAVCCDQTGMLVRRCCMRSAMTRRMATSLLLPIPIARSAKQDWR